MTLKRSMVASETAGEGRLNHVPVLELVRLVMRWEAKVYSARIEDAIQDLLVLVSIYSDIPPGRGPTSETTE